MSRRSYVILGLLFFIVVSTLPLLDGLSFKKKFYHAIDIVNRDKRVNIKILSYQQGWFSSSAQLHLSITNENLNELPEVNMPVLKAFSNNDFLLEIKIQHGPIVYDRSEKKIKFNYAQIHGGLLQASNKKEIIQIDAFPGFDGTWTAPILYFKNNF